MPCRLTIAKSCRHRCDRRAALRRSTKKEQCPVGRSANNICKSLPVLIDEQPEHFLAMELESIAGAHSYDLDGSPRWVLPVYELPAIDPHTAIRPRRFAAKLHVRIPVRLSSFAQRLSEEFDPPSRRFQNIFMVPERQVDAGWNSIIAMQLGCQQNTTEKYRASPPPASYPLRYHHVWPWYQFSSAS